MKEIPFNFDDHAWHPPSRYVKFTLDNWLTSCTGYIYTESSYYYEIRSKQINVDTEWVGKKKVIFLVDEHEQEFI